MYTLKKLKFYDIYDYKELISLFPCFAETLYSVYVDSIGYVHDVRIMITLVPSLNPIGWDNLEDNFNKKVLYCSEMWSIATKFGYH